MKHEEKMKIITNYLIKQKSRKELISDVYIRLAKSNLEKYDTEDSLIKLATTSIKNMQLDYYRSQQRKRVDIIDKDISDFISIGFLEDNNTFTSEEYENALKTAKNKLSTKQQEILQILIDNPGIKNKEIAEMLNANINTITSHRKRMYDILTKKIDK
jgi:RNA polymerase sigma factor (sigma-70 family)